MDGWFKTINNVANLTGSIVFNLLFNFFDVHNSHWDNDVLDEMKMNHIHTYLLKAGDSENDQPNDNGLRGCFK